MNGPSTAWLITVSVAALILAVAAIRIAMRPAARLVVDATWDDEAGVWYAKSEDVPGLAIEAPSIEELHAKLCELVPFLLSANDREHDRSRPVELMAHRLIGQ